VSKRICRAYDYSTAEESRKPGYLARKFDKERKRLAEIAAKAEAEAEAISVEAAIKVHVLKGATK
jgi:hypothetical protein